MWGVELQLHSFLNLTQDGVGGQLYILSTAPPENSSCIHLVGEVVGAERHYGHFSEEVNVLRHEDSKPGLSSQYSRDYAQRRTPNPVLRVGCIKGDFSTKLHTDQNICGTEKKELLGKMRSETA